ncbi:MAG: helix-turn-helix transcriptional regulator [Candidatus Peribacteraceae bacterium]|nr:helix-turn-helix transcriptional regulator [Methanocellales archaeon]MDD5742298.1 helix-turn-helix transcriptional regulator [Candidatus Peribacteraceae bacterium]
MQDNICQQLSDRIRYLREKHELTQEELARKAGISTNYLQNLESDHPKNATVITLGKLAKGFDIPVWQLLKFK